MEEKLTCEQETEGRGWRPSRRNHGIERCHYCRGIYQKLRESRRAKPVPWPRLERERLPASDTPECLSSPAASSAEQHSSHSDSAAASGQDMLLDGLPPRRAHAPGRTPRPLSLPASSTPDTISKEGKKMSMNRRC